MTSIDLPTTPVRYLVTLVSPFGPDVVLDVQVGVDSFAALVEEVARQKRLNNLSEYQMFESAACDCPF